MFRIAGTYKSPSSQSYVFSRRHIWMLELAHKESWAQKNWCFWTVVLEKTLESSVDYKEIKLVNPKGNQSWIFIGILQWCWGWNSNILATWCEELTCLKRLWCWERLKVGGEGDNRGRDGWMASPTGWTRVWVSSGSWSWTGKPGMIQSMGSQRVGHGWATELSWYVFICLYACVIYLHTSYIYIYVCVYIFYEDCIITFFLSHRTTPSQIILIEGF